MHGHFLLIFMLKYVVQSDVTYGLEVPDSICNSTIRNNVRYALSTIVNTYFVPNSSDLMVSAHAKREQSWRLMQDLLTCAASYMFNIKLQIETINAPRLSTPARKYNLLLIDGPQALM